MRRDLADIEVVAHDGGWVALYEGKPVRYIAGVAPPYRWATEAEACAALGRHVGEKMPAHVVIADPLGLEPDRVRVDLERVGEQEGIDALGSIMDNNPESRLRRLEGIPAMANRVAVLKAELQAEHDASAATYATTAPNTGDRLAIPRPVSDALLARLAQAETAAARLRLGPAALRAQALEQAQHKPRGSRSPLLDEWLDNALRQTPRATAKMLWRRLPDDSDRDLYRDGDLITEHRANGVPRRGIGFDAFEKRLTLARQRATNRR